MPSVCQAPLQRQPASAPSPSTISFVPLTRNLPPAAPSLAPSTALGTRNGPRPGVDRPLRGNCHPLSCALDNQVRCVFGSAPKGTHLY